MNADPRRPGDPTRGKTAIDAGIPYRPRSRRGCETEIFFIFFPGSARCPVHFENRPVLVRFSHTPLTKNVAFVQVACVLG